MIMLIIKVDFLWMNLVYFVGPGLFSPFFIYDYIIYIVTHSQQDRRYIKKTIKFIDTKMFDLCLRNYFDSALIRVGIIRKTAILKVEVIKITNIVGSKQ